MTDDDLIARCAEVAHVTWTVSKARNIPAWPMWIAVAEAIRAVLAEASTPFPAAPAPITAETERAPESWWSDCTCDWNDCYRGACPLCCRLGDLPCPQDETVGVLFADGPARRAFPVSAPPAPITADDVRAAERAAFVAGYRHSYDGRYAFVAEWLNRRGER